MRRSIIPAAMLAAAALLVGCGDSGNTADDGEDTTETDTTETDEDEAPAAEGSLVVWVDANRQPAVTAAAETFTAETGVEVELVEKNFEDIRADFLAQVPTGEGPDITVGAHDWLGSFIVDGVVDSVDLTDKVDEFEQVAIEGFSYDGQLYGLPYALESVALIRNTELAPDPVEGDFDALIAAGRDTDATYPLVVDTGGGDGNAYNLYAVQTSFGAPVFEQNDDGTYTTDVGMGGDGGFEFANWLGDQVADDVLSPDWTYDISVQEFSDGNAPFTINGPWAIGAFTDAGVEVEVDPIPGAGSETAAPFVGVQGFYVSAQSENQILANEFLVNYVATPEAMRALFDADPRPPAMTSVAQDVADDPVIAGFVAAAQNGVPMPSIPEMGQVWDFWNAAQSGILRGEEEPDAAWQRMLDDLDGALG